ncbi:MAG: hypothetical protein CMB28_01665 [Euryarchaeota archaeon]|nr:hypothetical protein [Euryarchaeota archaeon]|tara:strand:- start:1067 stop:1267 length:201 start_codon:yes stop_codon:yes gene_type:complete
MFSPHLLGVQESITSMTLRAITRDRILVFHIALASLARDSFRVKEKLLPISVKSSSLDRLDAIDLA